MQNTINYRCGKIQNTNLKLLTFFSETTFILLSKVAKVTQPSKFNQL